MDSLERQRRLHEIYEWAHIANDYLMAIFFTIGSFFFLSDNLQRAAIFLFIAGSLQMFIGPVIRTANKLHVKAVWKDVIHW